MTIHTWRCSKCSREFPQRYDFHLDCDGTIVEVYITPMDEMKRLNGEVDYLVREINRMRRVMQEDTNTWVQFCTAYGARYGIASAIAVDEELGLCPSEPT